MKQWVALGLAVALLCACQKSLTYDEQADNAATARIARDDAALALSKIQKLEARVDDLEDDVSSLRRRLGALESK